MLDPDGTAIEDHLVLADSLFRRAVAEYLAQIAPAKSADEYATRVLTIPGLVIP